MIDYTGINSAALSRYPGLLEQILPGGKQEGAEYVVKNPTRADSSPGSFKINVNSGKWSDFATDDSGSDPISLYAYLTGSEQSAAARALSKLLGMTSPTKRRPSKAAPNLDMEPATDFPQALHHYKKGEPNEVYHYHDSAGRVIGAACRFDHEGGKDVLPYTFCSEKLTWTWKAFSEPRPLYNLHELTTYPDLPVLVCEGEKATNAAKYLLEDKYLCTTWPGGCKAVNKADWLPLSGRNIVIWPDADKPGFEAALQIIEKLRDIKIKSVTIVLPPMKPQSGWDLHDALENGWSQESVLCWIKKKGLNPDDFLRHAMLAYDIKQSKPKKQAGNQSPFINRSDGIYAVTETNGDVEEEWLCSPLKVAASTRDVDSQTWGRLLEIEDQDGIIHKWAMPMALTAGNGDGYRATLLDLGLRLAPGTKNRNRLHSYITQANPEGRARCVPRIGWHGNVFVLPDTIYGSTDVEVVLQSESLDNPFREQGTLEEWQKKVGKLCEGNSRLAFAVSAAFSAPLLEPLGFESGGFHFYGGSSIGKTTILEVAGSICGGGGIKGFLQQWRTTDNALEGIAANHSDCLLCLDEMSQVNAKVAGDIAYMLANGQGKSRANKDGNNKKPQEWRTLFLSSGEITLADKVREDGSRRATAGQTVRIVDIPASAGDTCGAFETLHGYEDGHDFVQSLKDVTKEHFGTPFRLFLEKLTRRRSNAAKTVAEACKHFAESNCPDFADGQVKRVCTRFGLVAATGELAIAYGILPWKTGTATEAAATCFQAWLDARGGVEPAEVREGLAQVQRFFEAHGSSRFEDYDSEGEDRVHNRAGFRKKNDEGGWDYYVLPQVFRQEICEGFNLPTICKALYDRGLLKRSSENKNQVNKTLPLADGKKQMKVYHILSDIIGKGNDG